MENYLYFGTGGGANATGEAGCWSAKRLIGITPASATTTDILFEGQTGAGDGVDKITLTHLNSATVLDDQADLKGHKCKQIAEALSNALNSKPGVMIDIVDLDNNITLDGMPVISAVAITIDS